MTKYEIMSKLRKQFPTLMSEHYLAVEEYLDKIKTVDDTLALELASRYLANIKTKKKTNGKI